MVTRQRVIPRRVTVLNRAQLGYEYASQCMANATDTDENHTETR